MLNEIKTSISCKFCSSNASQHKYIFQLALKSKAGVLHEQHIAASQSQTYCCSVCVCDVKHSHYLLQMTDRFRLRRLSWDWRPVILFGGCQAAGLGLHLYISPSSSHSRSDMVPSQLPPSIQLAGSASSLKLYTDLSSTG